MCKQHKPRTMVSEEGDWHGEIYCVHAGLFWAGDAVLEQSTECLDKTQRKRFTVYGSRTTAVGSDRRAARECVCGAGRWLAIDEGL